MLISLLLVAGLCGATYVVDDFAADAPQHWQIAGTPEYYRGGFGARGLQIKQAPQRGRFLSAPVSFQDPGKSEVVFLTKTLDHPVPLADVRAVRFWYRLDGATANPLASFIVRLRTSPRQFHDINFFPAQPLVVGRWARAELKLDLSTARNVWGYVFDTVKWLTFRLDDVDDRQAGFHLDLAGLEIETAYRPPSKAYTPCIHPRPTHKPYRVLYARHAAAGFYGLRQALAEALPDASVEERLFRGLHFPLWWQAPSRADLLAYDLLLFVDVDPFILSQDEAEGLADAVASGASLLWFGGPNTFGASRRPDSPLFAILPVGFEPSSPKGLHGAFKPAIAPGAETHPLATCVPLAALSPVRHMNSLQPRPGSQVLLTARGKPLVVTARYHRGRTTVVSAWCDGAALPDFFTAPGSAAWKRRLLLWAASRLNTPWAYLESVSTVAPEAGQEVELRDRVAGDGAAKTQAQVSVIAQWRRMPADGEDWRPLRAQQTDEEKWQVRLPETPEPYKVRFVARVVRPGGRSGLSATTAPAGETGKKSSSTLVQGGEAEVTLEVQPRVKTEVVWARHKCCFAAGMRAEGSLRWKGLENASKQYEVSLKILEPGRRNAPLVTLPPLRVPADKSEVSFAFNTPHLVPGEYWLAVELGRRGPGQRTVSRAIAPFVVVDALDRSDFFPIITFLGPGSGGHLMDEDQLRLWVRDAWDHGFNTAAITGLSRMARDVLDATTARRNFIERFTQSLGMATIYEYGSFKLMGRAAPTKPCVFSPEYEQALRKVIEPQIDVALRVPRLLSVKITDEPVASLANVDGCEYCRAEFRRRYGVELPSLKSAPKDPYLRWALADFVGYYVQRGFCLGHKIVAEAAGARSLRVPSDGNQAHTGVRTGGAGGGQQSQDRPFDLLLTYMSAGLGFGHPLRYQEDPLDWSACCDRSDFDVYPYFYPSSQKVRMLTAWPCFAFQRAVARYRKQPWGFYIELDDRNWPFQKNPLQASSECAWTAVAQGANYLNSFIHRRFGTGNDARPERWEHLGRNLRIMRELGPLLARTRRPPAAVALYYPSAQQAIEDGYALPRYLFAALVQGFGEADLEIEEPVARRGAVGAAKCLVMSGVRVLDSRAIAPLVTWVKTGGVLAMDAWPQSDERGRAVDFSGALGAGAAEKLRPWQSISCGKGKVLCLPATFDADYRRAVEDRDEREAVALREPLARALADLGVVPTVRVEGGGGQIEAGLRTAPGVALVTLVNHASVPGHARVLVRAPGFAATFAWRAVRVSGREMETQTVPLKLEGSRTVFEAKLGARESCVVVLQPRRPLRVRLYVPARVRRGEKVRLRLRTDARDTSGLATLSARDPAGREVSALSGPLVLPAGERTLLWQIPSNASRGKYSLRVRLVGSSAEAHAGLQVE